MDDHGPFALGGLLANHVHKLQDAFGSICWRHTMIGPGCVVKMHHILCLVSLRGRHAKDHGLDTSPTLSMARDTIEDWGGATSHYFSSPVPFQL